MAAHGYRVSLRSGEDPKFDGDDNFTTFLNILKTKQPNDIL